MPPFLLFEPLEHFQILDFYCGLVFLKHALVRHLDFGGSLGLLELLHSLEQLEVMHQEETLSLLGFYFVQFIAGKLLCDLDELTLFDFECAVFLTGAVTHTLGYDTALACVNIPCRLLELLILIISARPDRLTLVLPSFQCALRLCIKSVFCRSCDASAPVDRGLGVRVTWLVIIVLERCVFRWRLLLFIIESSLPRSVRCDTAARFDRLVHE